MASDSFDLIEPQSSALQRTDHKNSNIHALRYGTGFLRDIPFHSDHCDLDSS